MTCCSVVTFLTVAFLCKLSSFSLAAAEISVFTLGLIKCLSLLTGSSAMNKLRQSFRRKKDVYVPESSRPHQWQTDEEAVRSGKCSFAVKVTILYT